MKIRPETRAGRSLAGGCHKKKTVSRARRYAGPPAEEAAAAAYEKLSCALTQISCAFLVVGFSAMSPETELRPLYRSALSVTFRVLNCS